MTMLLALALVVSLPQETARWSVGQAVLEIGTEFGEESYEFGRIRGVIQLPDGSIVVADQLNDQVRFFDAEGTIRHVRGRAGAGPGEFRLIKWLGRCGGDSLFVADVGNRRISIYKSTGELIGSQPLVAPVPGRSVWRIRCDDRHFLAVSPPEHPNPPSAGPFQGPVTIGWYDLSGSPVQSLGAFPGPEMYVRPSLTGAMPRPLGADIFVTILNSKAFIGVSNQRIIEVYNPDGSKRGELEVPFEARDVRQDDIEAAIDELVSGVSDEQLAARHRRELRGYEWPEMLPLYTAMIGDPAGYLWLRPHSSGGGGSQVEWRVVTTEGELVATVDVCSCVDIQQIGTNWVLGIQRSPLGGERVVRLPLVR